MWHLKLHIMVENPDDFIFVSSDDQDLKDGESKGNCSSCYQTTTQLVWTHRAKRTWRHHKNCATQWYSWKETKRQATHHGWTVSGEIGKQYGLDDQMTEDRKVWSTMVATVDTCYCTGSKVWSGESTVEGPRGRDWAWVENNRKQGSDRQETWVHEENLLPSWGIETTCPRE